MEKKDTKNNKEENKDDRVWLGDGGIIYVEVADRYNQESVFELFEKIAVYGGNVIARTVGSFVLAAAVGIKNVKLFENKERALKWLKKP